MVLTMPRSYFFRGTFLVKISLIFIFLILSHATLAASGPSVMQLSTTLDSTWNTLLKITNCNRTPPQDSVCIQAYNGKTIPVKLFGQTVNALILFETSTIPNVSGPLVVQQSGFLVGPLDGYGYKIVMEKMSQGQHDKSRITNNGLKVYAHKVTDEGISPQGIELNNGNRWLDGKNDPWIYHWDKLATVDEVLKQIKYDLNNKVW